MIEDSTEAGIATETRDATLHIRLARPERKNALGPDAVRRLISVLEAASTDDALGVIVIESTGDDFCSGADWVATNSAGGPKPRAGSIQRRTPVQAHRLIELMLEVQLPIVCVVRGWAAGLGCQMALAADFTVATDDSRFWEPFLGRGFSPDSGATWLLPRLVGVVRARELLLLGREVSGREAADWGLIHRAAPGPDLQQAVDEVVRTLADGPTVAIGLTKRLINNGLEGGLRQSLEAEAKALELTSRTADFKEGLTAFREKRQPDFQGR